MTKLVLLLLPILVIYVNARHIHPHLSNGDVWKNNVEEMEKSAPLEEETAKVELIRNMKPSRFVPINNAIFFMGYLPCQDGFKRDFMGVCREVWD